LRPNPNPFRDAMFKMTSIQTMRNLSEQEVQEINFIIKTRALKYIAAGKEEWLYPERQVPKSRWAEFGDGYLLMPDPRGVEFSREIIIGHRDGTASAIDEYGRRPWQPGFKDDNVSQNEFVTFHRFQGDFAKLYGPYRRGRAFNFMQLDPEKDSDKTHQYHLSLARKTWKERHRGGSGK